MAEGWPKLPPGARLGLHPSGQQSDRSAHRHSYDDDYRFHRVPRGGLPGPDSICKSYTSKLATVAARIRESSIT